MPAFLQIVYENETKELIPPDNKRGTCDLVNANTKEVNRVLFMVLEALKQKKVCKSQVSKTTTTLIQLRKCGFIYEPKKS